ncbi:BC1881 family protein [Bacillus pseudomycoides]|uniref:BC1881 family protein n=1 Tax=Bacillus bingmayongensis TaxID=1150157 RepID=A0ABU5JYS8_9BACI|nr:BC1881 family protein [Bacillus pseudomycoides]
MKDISTKALSEELETREGVTTVVVSPYEVVEVKGKKIEGPAVILINKD